MEVLIYLFHLYAPALITLGFLHARRKDLDLIFWGALGIAELSQMGLVAFLVRHGGSSLQVEGLLSGGLLLVEIAAILGIIGGVLVYQREKEAFPGLWVVFLSIFQLVLLVIFRELS
ncbi:MAG: hypothetical protein N2253_04830 [Bacteroidia bacterium]|nr:hypothetical protein [Bacteroidia bacterium]MCX7764200.1 hypothetical protein [Bacteroidia bacterium]MDW8058334.1 hypothetical protein [Bacteroidia bacterium]